MDKSQVDALTAASLAEVLLLESYHAYIAQVLSQKGIITAGTKTDYTQSFDAYIATRVDSVRNAYTMAGLPFDAQRVNHDVIAQDIDRMANALKQVCEAFDPTLQNDSDISLDNYRAMIWQGLIDSQAFANKWGNASNSNYNSLKNGLNSSVHDLCN